jgi:hypothetical protein
MNENANPNAPDPAAPAPPATPAATPVSTPITTPAASTPPAAGGTSPMKFVVPLVALVAVVFGVTFLTQNAPDKQAKAPAGKDEKKGGPVRSGGEPPLRFFTSIRVWDPPNVFWRAPNGELPYAKLPLLAPSLATPDPFNDPRAWSWDLANRVFQGVYEQNAQTARSVQFWFENRNPESVTLSLQGLRGTPSTQGTVIPIPPEVTRTLHQHAALAALPVGPFNPFGVGLLRPAAAVAALPREPVKYVEGPQPTYTVPGAGGAEKDKWAPYQWGILELGFGVGGKAGEVQEPLQALFAAQVDGTQRGDARSFGVMFEVAKPVDTVPAAIDVGRLDSSAADKTYGFIVYSSTRGPGSEYGDLVLTKADFAAQTPTGEPDPSGFLEVIKLERLPEDELSQVAQLAAGARKRGVRVRAAYGVTAVLHPQVGGARMEIGAVERTLAVRVGGAEQRVRFSGQMSGAAWLDQERGDIELGSFKAAAGVQRDVKVFVERPGLELAVVKGECKPDFCTYELLKQPDEAGRGVYKLRVTVPPGQQSGRISKGEVVLEVKGPPVQRMRLELRGSGLR